MAARSTISLRIADVPSKTPPSKYYIVKPRDSGASCTLKQELEDGDEEVGTVSVGSSLSISAAVRGALEFTDEGGRHRQVFAEASFGSMDDKSQNMEDLIDGLEDHVDGKRNAKANVGNVQVNSSIPAEETDLGNVVPSDTPDEWAQLQESMPKTPRHVGELVKDTPATDTRFKEIMPNIPAGISKDETQELRGYDPADEETAYRGNVHQSTDDEHASEATEDESVIDSPTKAKVTASAAPQAHKVVKDCANAPPSETPEAAFERSFFASGSESESNDAEESNTELPSHGDVSVVDGPVSTGQDEYSTPQEPARHDAVDKSRAASHDSMQDEHGKSNESSNCPVEATPAVTAKGSQLKSRKRKSPSDEPSSQASSASTKRLRSSQGTTSLPTPVSAKKALKCRGDRPAFLFSNSDINEQSDIKNWIQKVKAIVRKDVDGDNFDILIVGKGELKRTPKLLMAVALGKPVVTEDWLIASCKAGQLWAPEDYLARDTKHEKQWSFDPTSQADRTTLLKGKTVHVTPALKKDWGTKGYKNIEGLAKALGAKQVLAKPLKGKDKPSPGVIYMGRESGDADAETVMAEGLTCYSKELLPLGVLRGLIDWESLALTRPEAQPKKGRGKKR